MKKWSLLLFLFLLSGCQVEYTLDLTTSDLQNQITVLENETTLEEAFEGESKPNNEVYDASLIRQSYLETFTSFEGEKNFEKEFLAKENVYGYQYKQTLTDQVEELLGSNCYENIFLSTGENIRIETSDQFQCFHQYSSLDQVTFHIKTNGEVFENNADSIVDNTYNWTITKSNYREKPIIFEAENTFYKKETSPIWYIILIAFCIGILILVYKFYKKNYQKGY